MYIGKRKLRYKKTQRLLRIHIIKKVDTIFHFFELINYFSFLRFCVSNPKALFPSRKFYKKKPSIFLGNFIVINYHYYFPLCTNTLALPL